MSYIETIINPNYFLVEHSLQEKNVNRLLYYLNKKRGSSENLDKLEKDFESYYQDHNVNIDNIKNILSKKIDNIMIIRC